MILLLQLFFISLYLLLEKVSQGTPSPSPSRVITPHSFRPKHFLITLFVVFILTHYALFPTMSTLKKAIAIAVEAHKDQVDKTGSSYVEHLFRVMNLGKNEDEKICGVLHDLVEDTQWTFEDLAREGFSQHIIEALKCVTKTSEAEEYDQFIERVVDNRLAVAVKINDLTDNLDIRRFDAITERDVPRINKYLKAYKRLTLLKNL